MASPRRFVRTFSGANPGPSSAISMRPPLASTEMRTLTAAPGACRWALSRAWAVAATRASVISGEHVVASGECSMWSRAPASSASAATRATRSGDGGWARTDAVARAACSRTASFDPGVASATPCNAARTSSCTNAAARERAVRRARSAASTTAAAAALPAARSTWTAVRSAMSATAHVVTADRRAWVSLARPVRE
ncbi:hypothetical protein AVW09_04065 [Microbacterium sp. T32]|nr:hypothetical protein AVW09_04065 [Microbacterium sp. T32]